MEKQIFSWTKDTLTGLEIKPAKVPVRKMIVLLHGYRGDAESNMEFALKLADACPQAVVFVPDGTAPVPPGDDPHHRQWWALSESEFDGRLCSFMPYYAPADKQRLIKKTVGEIQKTAALLNHFILNRLTEYGLNLSDCFLAGISQGGITAFEMTLFRSELHGGGNDFLGGLISIGSGIIGADRLRELSLPPVPVLLARGRHEEIFPKTVDYFSRSLLQELRMPVVLTEADSAHFGLEHKVCGDVCRFIREHC